jgi:N-acylneuraminate cytidylyltransferase
MSERATFSRVLCLIPARGGSKGIRRKNLREVGGIPLIVWSIRQALSEARIERVVVSTDDAEIAQVAAAAGAGIVWRPAELATDTASSESALLHALDDLRAREGYEPDLVVFLQATSPVRRPGQLSAAIAHMEQQAADSLFSGRLLQGFVWRLADVVPQSVTYDHRARPRRQEAQVHVEETGSFYLVRPEILRRDGNRLGGRVAYFEQDLFESLQIDEPADLAVCEDIVRVRAPAAVEAAILRDVRLVVFDFDGVFTDNRVLVDETGRESVACSRADGWGLRRLREAGVEALVLSTEENPVVSARCRKLGLPCLHGAADKAGQLRAEALRRGVDLAAIAFVGNDLNDLECMRLVGVPIAVADAVDAVKAAARLVTRRVGGDDAVREICDWFVAARGGASP